MERPQLDPLSARPRPQLPEISVGIPEMLAMGVLTAGEPFVVVWRGVRHEARLLDHGAVELDGETYLTLRQALESIGPFVFSCFCYFDRTGPVDLWEIRQRALEHPDVKRARAAQPYGLAPS